MNGETHAERLARHDTRDEEFLRRLDRIENKVDNLIPTVAKIGGSVALIVSIGTTAAAIAMFG